MHLCMYPLSRPFNAQELGVLRVVFVHSSRTGNHVCTLLSPVRGGGVCAISSLRRRCCSCFVLPATGFRVCLGGLHARGEAWEACTRGVKLGRRARER